MAKKLPIWDQRMFELMEIKLKRPDHNLEDEMVFFKPLGINTAPTISQVRAGRQSFRLNHFKTACDLHGVSMDWFMGYTDKMNRKQVSMDPVAMLKQATSLIQKQLNGKIGVHSGVHSKGKKVVVLKKRKK